MLKPAPAQPTPMTDTYTVDDVAHLLKVCTKTVRNQINAGTLAAIRVGRCIRVTDAALQDYVARTQHRVPVLPTRPRRS